MFVFKFFCVEQHRGDNISRSYYPESGFHPFHNFQVPSSGFSVSFWICVKFAHYHFSLFMNFVRNFMKIGKHWLKMYSFITSLLLHQLYEYFHHHLFHRFYSILIFTFKNNRKSIYLYKCSVKEVSVFYKPKVSNR